MICTNCGLCCIDYMVVIIKPEYLCDTIQEFEKLDQEAFMGKDSGNPCTYLYWEDGKSRCKIHNYEWYKLTPCYDFTQIEESADCLCRLGEYIDKNQPGYYEQYHNEFQNNYLSPDEFQKKMNISLKDIKNDQTGSNRT